MIQLINWSLPIKIQQAIMPKLIVTLNAYFQELKKIDLKSSVPQGAEKSNTNQVDVEDESSVAEEDLENMDIIADDENAESNEEDHEEMDEDERQKKIQEEEEDLGLVLFQ